MGPRNQKFHNKFFFFHCTWLPNQNRKAYKHSNLTKMYVWDNYVLRLEISMSYPQIMKIIYWFSDLPNYGSRFILGQFPFFQLLVKSATIHILKNYIKVSLVVKEAIHSKDISMIKTALKTNLQSQLIDHHMRFYHWLRYFFQSKQPQSFLMPDNINRTEFTFSKLFTNLELVHFRLLTSNTV